MDQTFTRRSRAGAELVAIWASGELRPSQEGEEADAYRVLTATERRATPVNIDIFHEAQMSLIHHVITGSGRPSIVFVHGLACAHTDWEAQVAHFAPRHLTVSVDLREQGASNA